VRPMHVAKRAAMADLPPGHAFVAWAKSIPSVRCAATALAPWTHATAPSVVPITETKHFDLADVRAPLGQLTTVAAKSSLFWYAAATVARGNIVVLHAGSEAAESDFTAVLGDAPRAPKPLATLSHAPQLGTGLGIGSPRTSVERVLGPAKSHPACGYDVVRYQPLQAEMSQADVWVIYHHGVVAAFSRSMAV
jgi:hypothetical protein